MKIYKTVGLLVCAAWMVCSCATTAGHGTASAKKSPTPATQGAATAQATDDTDSSPPEMEGKGNVDSIAHYAAGVSYELNDKHDLAVEEFVKAVEADPANETKAIELAGEFLKEQQPDKAIAMLTKVAAHPGASSAIFSWLARAELQAGKTNDAIAISKQAIQRQPDLLDGYESQLEIWMITGKMSEALRTLTQARKHIPNEPASLIGLASLYSDYLRMIDKDAPAIRATALALLDRAQAMKISSSELRQHLADAYGGLGELKKAAALYTKLVAESPDTADDSLERDALRERLAQMYLDAHEWTNAANLFQTIVKNDPARHPEAWFYLGIIAHAQGDLTNASDNFEQALHWDANMEEAYYRLALVRADMNHGNEALTVLNVARTRFRENFQGEFFTAMVYSQLKIYDEAVRHYTEAEKIALASNPARLDRQFYFQLGAACERNHQYQDAENYLQKCIDMGPDDAEALNYLGFMWADRGEKLVKARAYIEKAVKMEPKNGAFLDSMGWVLFKQNQPQQALPWLVQAVAVTPEPDPTILDHLGDVYMALHQTGKALEMWKKSLSIESNPDVKKKVQLFDGGAT